MGGAPGVNPLEGIKESMKELQDAVQRKEAKSMGGGAYTVYEKVQKVLRKRDKKSNQVYKKLKVLMKNRK